MTVQKVLHLDSSILGWRLCPVVHLVQPRSLQAVFKTHNHGVAYVQTYQVRNVGRLEMRPFILLDLYSQAAFIPPDVRTWPRQRVRGWLRQYGEVQEWPLPFGDMASEFRAPSGLTTTFILTDDGKLSIYLGEHCMVTVWR